MEVNNRQTIYPWVVISLAALMLFYKYLLSVFPSVITDQLIETFSLSNAGLGNLAACFFYSYLVMQFFSGYLIDRYNMRLIICLSLLVSALGALFFSLAETITTAIIGRALMGIGAAFATVGYLKTASLYFSKKQFPTVSGLLTVGVMLGAVFGEAPLALLIKKIGWQDSLMLVALIGAIISLLFFTVVRAKQPTHSDMTPVNWQQVRQIFKRKSNWCLTLYSGLAFAPLAVFGGLWGTPFVVSTHGLSHAGAAAVTSIVYIGFGFGGPIFGLLAQRGIDPYRLMRYGLFLSLLALVLIIYSSVGLLYLGILVCLFGLGTGGFMLGFTVGTASNPLALAATVVALINSGDAICGALTEPFVGKLLDIKINNHLLLPTHFSKSAYHYAFAVLPVELLAAFVFLYLAERSLRGKKQASDNAC